MSVGRLRVRLRLCGASVRRSVGRKGGGREEGGAITRAVTLRYMMRVGPRITCVCVWDLPLGKARPS